MITDAGRLHIMRFLAGQVAPLAGSIALGSGARAAAVSDTRLTYEFDRATIYLSSLDYITRRLVFKGTVSSNTIGSIYEVGLYSTEFGSFGTGSPSRTLAIFEQGAEAWSGDTFVSGNHRIGLQALRLNPAASGTLSSVLPSVNLDLSAYSNSDEFTLAVYANANTSSIRVRFRGVDPAAYYETTITPTTGYNTYSWTKSSMTKTGVLDWTSIDSIEVSASSKAAGAAIVDFDGIRVEATVPDVDNVLISRSVLGTPIVKNDAAEMDIEYALEVNI